MALALPGKAQSSSEGHTVRLRNFSAADTFVLGLQQRRPPGAVAMAVHRRAPQTCASAPCVPCLALRRLRLSVCVPVGAPAGVVRKHTDGEKVTRRPRGSSPGLRSPTGRKGPDEAHGPPDSVCTGCVGALCRLVPPCECASHVCALEHTCGCAYTRTPRSGIYLHRACGLRSPRPPPQNRAFAIMGTGRATHTAL